MMKDTRVAFLFKLNDTMKHCMPKIPLFYKEMLPTLVDLPAEMALVNKGTCLFNNLFLPFPVPGHGVNTPDICRILTNGTIT